MTPANLAGPRSQFTRSLRGVQALIQAMTGASEERLRRREYMARETERELARGERRERFEWERTRAAEAFGAAEAERKERGAMRRAEFREEYGYEPGAPGAPGAVAAAPVSGVGAPAEIVGTSRKPVIERLARKQAMSAEADARARGLSEAEIIAAGRKAYREAKIAAAGMKTRRARELERAIPAPHPLARGGRAPVVEVPVPLPARLRLGIEAARRGREIIREAEERVPPLTFAETMRPRREEVRPIGPQAEESMRQLLRRAQEESRRGARLEIPGGQLVESWVEDIMREAPEARRPLYEELLRGPEAAPTRAQEAFQEPGAPSPRVRLPQPGEDPEVFASRLANLDVPSEEIDLAMEMHFPSPTHTRR